MFTMDPVTMRAIKKYPDRAVDIANSYDPNKIDAKKFLVKQIKQLQSTKELMFPLQRVYIVGGWYGNILIPLIFENVAVEEIQLIDIDETALAIARNIFFRDEYKIKYVNKDATTLEFRGQQRLVINTSAEHMKPLNCDNIPMCIQSNDYRDVDDHINCVDSTDQLMEQYNFQHVWHNSERQYKTPSTSYKRFTVIGLTK